MNDQENNSVAPPNQNLKIFTNPMPNHSISFVKESETKKNDLFNFDTDREEMVGLVEIEPLKDQNKKPLDISFSSRDILKIFPNGPLYIASQINDNPTNAILINPTY
jgi:hypothetical protein